MKNETVENAWDGDTEFQDSTIEKVDRSGDGWSITKSDGWSFQVPGTSPVEPKVGSSVRMYGPGIGCIVRGLFIDGACVFYRTPAEQEKHFADQMYGKDAADVVSRWDAGRGIWSIAMGGFGPGYEQALQTAMIEVLRELVAGGAMDKLEAVLERTRPLGLSVMQWSAARSLARAIYTDGPQAVLARFAEDRKIQVSRNFVSLETAKEIAVLKKALEFYADPANWVPGRWPADTKDGPDDIGVVDGLICVGRQVEENGTLSVADGGEVARAAIAALNGT